MSVPQASVTEGDGHASGAMMTSPASPADHRALSAIRPRGLAAVAVFVASLPASVVIPFLFVRLIAQAQDACFNVAGGQAFYLMVTWFELIVVGWVLLVIGAIVGGRLRLRPAASLGLGTALVLAMCLVATWQLVPWGPSTDYAMTTVGRCGPGGIPTWWPPVLPHH